MMKMKAETDHPVHHLIAERWSPYGYSEKEVSREDLFSIFEAARWAASCYNEQPWAYVIAVRSDPAAHERLLSCLVEANRQWAKAAPVLALGLARLRFSRNDQPNRHALHDLGLASANLSLEAAARGLMVHQMGGILPERARELYRIPEGWDVVTGLAIGYPGESGRLPQGMQERDRARRPRKPLSQFVFAGTWGAPA